MGETTCAFSTLVEWQKDGYKEIGFVSFTERREVQMRIGFLVKVRGHMKPTTFYKLIHKALN